MINLDIDRLSREKDGFKTIAKAIANVSVNPKQKQDEITSWQYYYAKQSSDAYDYLLKHGDYSLPAKPKFYPKQRSYINLLVSTFEMRPFIYSVNACNREAVKNKYENRIKEYVVEMMTRIKQKQSGLKETVKQINMQIQQMESMASQQPSSEAEAQQQQMVIQMLPQIRMQLNAVIDMAKTEELFSRDDIEKMERYYTYDKKDYNEELAQKAAKKLRERFNMKRLSKKNFICKLVAGRFFYYVNYDSLRGKFVYDIVNSLKIVYPDHEDVEWVQDLPWVKVEEYMTPDAIISNWGHILTKTEIEKVRELGRSESGSGNDQFLALPGGVALDLGADEEKRLGNETGVSPKSSSSGIKVDKIWWRAQRKIVAIKKKNPHKNDYFTHFVPDDRVAIPKEEYTYDSESRMYIHKKDKTMTVEKDRALLVKVSKDQEIIKRYVDDRYWSVTINDDIVIGGLDDIQPRSNDDYSRVPLPVIGKTHNSLTDLPYSVMMITKGLADTYNLLHLHREIILALSGVAGILIDMSQKPDKMSKDEWFYQMKMGRYLIQTVRAGRQVSSFNQFNRFDMSFSASVQYIDGMILQCDEAIGDIIGISRPRKGDVSPQDQVGTAHQSKVQSELRTEVYFTDFEDVEREAFATLLNLYSKYGLEHGDIIELIGEDQSIVYGDIKKNAFDDIDFSILLTNNRKQEAALHELKAIGKQYADQGRIPYHGFVGMYLAESVVELQKMAKYYDRKLQQAQEEMQTNAQESQAQAMQQVEQMKAELAMQLKGIEAQLKEKDMELRAGIEESKMAIEKERMALDAKVAEDNKQLKLLEIVNQDKIETAVVQENREARKSDQQIKAIQTKLDVMFKMLQLQLQNKDSNYKHDEALKKIKVDDKKASKKMVKEHVRDN